MSSIQTKTISINEIRPNPVALRAVNLESEDVIALRDSIKQYGLMNAISVRKRQGEDGSSYYELIDGLHRWTCCRELGIEQIPVVIKDLAEDEILEAQMVANMHNIETTPSQYTEQLKRIMQRNPRMTEPELAKRLCRSTDFIVKRLSLGSITDSGIKSLVDDGKIPLTNAYVLAKLPADEQKDMVESAMTEDNQAFAARVQARAKEIRDAKRAGASATPPVFEARAFLRKLSEIEPALAAAKGEYAEALKWVLHLDSESINAAKAKWDAEQKQSAEKRAKRDEESTKRKQLKALRLSLEAENAQAEINGKPGRTKDEIDKLVAAKAAELGISVSPIKPKAATSPAA